MSFRCQKCGEAKPPGAQPVRQVVETRQKEYPARHTKTTEDFGGSGWEIVREIVICKECAARMKHFQDQ